MALQTVINGRQVPGIAGEFSDTSVKSAREYICYGTSDSANPVFGKFFSIQEKALSTGSAEKSTVAVQGYGNTSWSMGILVNPKEHFTNGFVTTLEMNSGSAGTIATRGHIWVMSKTTTVAGEPVYVNANGDLGSEDLSGNTKVKVLGAKWLKSVALGNKTEVLSEVAIDNPTLLNEVGPGSL